MLFMPLFIALCVKLDPGTHKGMHSVLAENVGVTIHLYLNMPYGHVKVVLL
jgi:hypothetical protein